MTIRSFGLSSRLAPLPLLLLFVRDIGVLDQLASRGHGPRLIRHGDRDLIPTEYVPQHRGMPVIARPEPPEQPSAVVLPREQAIPRRVHPLNLSLAPGPGDRPVPLLPGDRGIVGPREDLGVVPMQRLYLAADLGNHVDRRDIPGDPVQVDLDPVRGIEAAPHPDQQGDGRQKATDPPGLHDSRPPARSARGDFLRLSSSSGAADRCDP
jgi:hypothetical protein